MIEAVPIEWVLVLAAALFCIGLFGALARRSAVSILMGIELMLNSVNINMVTFWRYFEPHLVSGQMFAVIIITVAAAEAAIGLAMIIAIYRSWQTVQVEELDSMKG